MAEGHAVSMGEPVFDRARLDDLEALLAIDASGQHWTRDALVSELGNDPKTLHVLRLNDKVVAFVVTRMVGADMDIVNVAVGEGHRRLGLGRKLLQMLFDHAVLLDVRKAFLEVRDSNRTARALYASLGFEETQRRRNFYSSPTEDAVLMSLKIDGPHG